MVDPLVPSQAAALGADEACWEHGRHRPKSESLQSPRGMGSGDGTFPGHVRRSQPAAIGGSVASTRTGHAPASQPASSPGPETSSYANDAGQNIRRVVDALSDDTYLDLTRIAAALFDAPMAAITILDGTTQWLRARHGLALERTPRREALCHFTASSPGGELVILDARQDARFKHFPLVTGATGVRFYAGVALVAPDGESLGAICVMDRRAGLASAQQMQALAALSRQVVALLELARSMEALERHMSERAWYEDRLRDSYRLLERQTAHLTRQALSDHLTGAPNRRAFDQDLARWLAAPGGETRRFALSLIDLDSFKPLNDQHGHPAGDVVLRTIVRSIRKALASDILVARLGGDEFALLIPGSRDLETELERARRAVAAAGAPHRITASIGATLFRSGDDADQLVVRADAALYAAKRRGGNQIVIA